MAEFLLTRIFWVFFFVEGSLSLSTKPSMSKPATPMKGLWNLTKCDVEFNYTHNIDGMPDGRPLIIAHRGFSGILPEQTNEAYKAAVESGADVIECDAGLTKDKRIVCLHESWLNETTDVASKFPESKANNYNVDNKFVHDFFSIDFTFEELRTLDKVQSLEFRDQQYNGMYKIATLSEMMKIANSSDRRIGIHVEIKDPDLYNGLLEEGIIFEEMVVKEMLAHGCKDDKRSPCFIQSFDKKSLEKIRTMTKLPLIYLTWEPNTLPDSLLDEISSWAYGVGPWKQQVLDEEGLIERCHKRGLKVHAYTFRNEFQYLLPAYKQDPYLEMAAFFKLRLDAYFTDFPLTAYNFFKAVYAYYK